MTNVVRGGVKTTRSVPIISGPHAGDVFDIPVGQERIILPEFDPQPIYQLGSAMPVDYIEPRTVCYEVRRRRCGNNSAGAVDMFYAVPDWTDKDDVSQVDRYFMECRRGDGLGESG